MNRRQSQTEPQANRQELRATTTADQDSSGHQVWDVNYSDTRKPVNKCQNHGAKPTKNNLSVETIKIRFRNIYEFWTDHNYVQSFGKL